LERRGLEAVLIAPAAINRLQQLQLTEVEQPGGYAVLAREITGPPEVLVRERQRKPRGEISAEQRGRHAPGEGHVVADDAALAERLDEARDGDAGFRAERQALSEQQVDAHGQRVVDDLGDRPRAHLPDPPNALGEPV